MTKKLKLGMLLAFFQVCSINAQVIEDFEAGQSTLSSSTFRKISNVGFNILDCNISPLFGNPYTPVVGLNLPNQWATIVTSGTNEPISFQYGHNQNIVSPNGGNYALRLNDINTAGADRTSYTKSFRAESRFLSFEYLAVLDSDHVTNLNVQPFFTARVLDQNDQIIANTQFCLIADPSDPLIIKPSGHLYMTNGWYCGSITIPEEYLFQQLKVQFVAADCGQGGHQGVTYIDNITNDLSCESPQYGYIKLNNQQYPCPTEKIDVCGTYSAPKGSSLSEIYLEIKQNGIVVNTLDINYANIIDDNNFCFSVDPSDFLSLSGEFEFNVIAHFQSSNGFNYTLDYESTFIGPDVNCNCITDEIFNTWQDVDNIYWTNYCEGPYILQAYSDSECCPENWSDHPGAINITLSGNSISKWDVLLALQDKCFRWRIVFPNGTASEWCCLTSYPYGADVTDYYNIGCINSVTVSPRSNIVAFPNPTFDKINVLNSQSSTFEIYDYNGVKVKTINDKSIEKVLDLSELKKGFYIIKADKGEEIKVIKK